MWFFLALSVLETSYECAWGRIKNIARLEGGYLLPFIQSYFEPPRNFERDMVYFCKSPQQCKNLSK
jgi:hypothetical protein